MFHCVALYGTLSVQGCIPTQSVGTIRNPQVEYSSVSANVISRIGIMFHYVALYGTRDASKAAFLCLAWERSNGDSDAVGDDVVPGGNKFTDGGYTVNAFIPRLSGTLLRLNGAKLDESIFNVVNKTLSLSALPTIPGQSEQGVINFQFAESAAGQGLHDAQNTMTYTVNGDIVSVRPTRRIRVDTSRADGVIINAEGVVEVVTGGLVTTFVPSVVDPKMFSERMNQVLPGSVNTLRWNGSWQLTAADGTTYIVRPQWSFKAAKPGAALLSATEDGNYLYSDYRRAQVLFPDFYDYDTLQATFRTKLKDPSLTVLPRMDGTAVATASNGKTYILTPQWTVTKPDTTKPAWWEENGVFHIKNLDNSAQGFTVK